MDEEFTIDYELTHRNLSMKTSFPHAPAEWSKTTAINTAEEQGIHLTEDHWDVMRSLQEYFLKNKHNINLRELNDALEERFKLKGGIKYLHTLFPEGPIAQGCEIAGLQLPPGAIDKSFGSVM